VHTSCQRDGLTLTTITASIKRCLRRAHLLSERWTHSHNNHRTETHHCVQLQHNLISSFQATVFLSRNTTKCPLGFIVTYIYANFYQYFCQLWCKHRHSDRQKNTDTELLKTISALLNVPGRQAIKSIKEVITVYDCLSYTQQFGCVKLSLCILYEISTSHTMLQSHTN